MPETNNVPRAVQRCHELMAWLIPLLDQFPRSRRFTLGERLKSWPRASVLVPVLSPLSRPPSSL